MPEDDERTTVEAGDNTESSEGGQASKGGKKKLILFGGIGLAAILVGVVVAMFVIKPMLSGSDEAVTEEDRTQVVESSHADKDEKQAETKHKKPRKKKPKGSHGGKEESFIYTIKDVVVNPAGTGGSRFLSVSFAFELESPELEAKFEAKEAMVRDALITILSSKTVSQLTETKQKEITRYQIKKRVSQIMRTDELAGVYFTDFVLQ